MVYLIIDSEFLLRVLFVQAKSEKNIRERLRLRETQRIVGILTEGEIHVLCKSNIPVISVLKGGI